MPLILPSKNPFTILTEREKLREGKLTTPSYPPGGSSAAGRFILLLKRYVLTTSTHHPINSLHGKPSV